MKKEQRNGVVYAEERESQQKILLWGFYKYGKSYKDSDGNDTIERDKFKLQERGHVTAPLICVYVCVCLILNLRATEELT